MSILTTCIGAYPKPAFVKLPDWFNLPAGPDTSEPTAQWGTAMQQLGGDGESAEAVLARGVQQVIADQLDAGIDIPTDGELPRENYIHYHCRHLHGFDFENLTEKEVRGGTYSARLPTIRDTVSAKDSFLPADWQRAQRCTDNTVKITMPGPMTIADTNYDAHYGDPAQLGADLAQALNAEVLALARVGCRHIQIDEPVFARRPADALQYGIENLERAFHGCPAEVTRALHICCGYPDRLDRDDYPKAEPDAYFQLADALEDSTVQWLSIEDAHRHNDLKLLERFKTTTVVLGAVAIAKSRIESADEVHARLCEALNHIDQARLVAAPDCGLGLLGRDRAREKLRSLSAAAKRL
ncbi:MAG: 5-methyltetrahydropteroyltriglutamate--homocysteine methyltransferase [Gammaproteobacteria bacterium]|nr:5-methyltetrahydropteroyltriglutamate--homocysteine methyltransferase [Gammaproteobacteria bacterium]